MRQQFASSARCTLSFSLCPRLSRVRDPGEQQLRIREGVGERGHQRQSATAACTHRGASPGMGTRLAKGAKSSARSVDQVRGALSQEADRHLCSPRCPGPAEEVLLDGGLGLGRIVARRQPDANLRARDGNQFVRGPSGGRCVNSEDGHGRAAPESVGQGAGTQEGDAGPSVQLEQSASTMTSARSRSEYFFRKPSMLGDATSSSPSMNTEMVTGGAPSQASNAAACAAIPALSSAVPRPNSRPSRSVASNGFEAHRIRRPWRLDIVMCIKQDRGRSGGSGSLAEYRRMRAVYFEQADTL